MAARPAGQGPVLRILVPLVAGLAIVAAGLGFVLLTMEPPPPAAVSQPQAARIVLETVGPAGRDVTPLGVTPGPTVDGPLERVPAEVRTTVAPRVPEVLLRRVMVIEAGRIRAVRDRQAVVVSLAGIEAPAFDRTCTDEAGKSWRCGARARAELARLIGGRAVRCVFADGGDPLAPVGRCRVGTINLSEWMIRQGWASPAPDAPAAFSADHERARAGARGLFGPAPSGVIAG